MVEAPAILRVEVVYALPGEAWRVALQLPPGSTVDDALRRSGLLERLPEGASSGRFGVFGRLVEASTMLRDGDRVELYRALQCDPKDVRRRRAAQAPPRRR